MSPPIFLLCLLLFAVNCPFAFLGGLLFKVEAAAT